MAQIRKMRSQKERRDSCSWRGEHRKFVKQARVNKHRREYWKY